MLIPTLLRYYSDTTPILLRYYFSAGVRVQLKSLTTKARVTAPKFYLFHLILRPYDHDMHVEGLLSAICV